MTTFKAVAPFGTFSCTAWDTVLDVSHRKLMEAAVRFKGGGEVNHQHNVSYQPVSLHP